MQEGGGRPLGGKRGPWALSRAISQPWAEGQGKGPWAPAVWPAPLLCSAKAHSLGVPGEVAIWLPGERSERLRHLRGSRGRVLAP